MQNDGTGKFIDVTPAMNRKNINFTFYKNKELVQTGNSADMIFSVDSLIAHISNYFSLNIGDLIFTGTPAGVGECVVIVLNERAEVVGGGEESVIGAGAEETGQTRFAVDP